jgi:hypothetical protein
VCVDTDGRTVDEVAAAIHRRIGSWPGPGSCRASVRRAAPGGG